MLKKIYFFSKTFTTILASLNIMHFLHVCEKNTSDLGSNLAPPPPLRKTLKKVPSKGNFVKKGSTPFSVTQRTVTSYCQVTNWLMFLEIKNT